MTCINTPIDTIKYSTFGATGVIASGLPSGVIGSWTSNVFTISGTPTASGTFNYTVTMTGGCTGGTNTATGSITVNPLPPSDISALSTTIFCEGDSVVIQGNNIVDAIYNWSNQNGIISNSNYSSFSAYETGTYSYEIIDTNNCSNHSNTMDVIVNTHNPSEIYTTSLGPFTLNGTTYGEAGVYIQNLQTVNGCDSILTLHLEIENVSIVQMSDECAIFIYPNPSKENTVYFKNPESCQIELETILDIYGRQVGFVKDQNKVQLLTEVRGVYFLILSQNNIIKRHKIILD
jgi:hypothetical protein